MSRFITSLLSLIAIVVLSLPLEALGQGMGHGRGNAHVMDLSIQFDTPRNKIACLGDPNELHVKPGDTVVLRARGAFVNNVSWDPDSVSSNKGKSNLAVGNLHNSRDFRKGAAFAFKINESIRDTTAYELKATCGDVNDDPPRVIVDP
jgi:hypothetical protein